MPPDPILEIAGLHGYYGESHVLHGVDLMVGAGEVATIVGRNGAGKTTTLRAVMGMLAKRSGSIRVMGVETITLPPERVARLGVGYVPEERGIFASLNVAENLFLPPIVAQGGMTADDIYALFPNLRERARAQGSKLSGGEQQMLAIARVLRTGAKFLILDEPTEGLAPVLVQQVGHVLEAIKSKGLTVLLVEQNFRFAARVSDQHYVMESGRIIDRIVRADVAGQMGKLEKYLGF
jgi:branched-chain amino acid transport system ATP-binding protein